MAEIVELAPEEAEARLAHLSDLLLDAVAGGASVSFLADSPRAAIERFWRDTIGGMAAGRTLLFAALDEGKVVGCVLLHPAGQLNQPHRADVAKLLVHSAFRRKGIANRLMEAMEARARQIGRTLLTLDTARGSAAEPLYIARGYQRAGAIPDYSLTTDGRLETTVIYCKRLA